MTDRTRPSDFVRSFAFAWAGLAEGAVRDRNLRFHLAMGILAGAFAARAPIAPGERALLVLCVVVVVAAESANSALEAAVDLASPERNERARIAKDCAAGAVLTVAAGSVLAFVAIAGPRSTALLAAARRLTIPAGGALVAAVAAAILPWPGSRSLAFDLVLALAGIGGIVAVAIGAEGLAGPATAALCLAVSLSGAARSRSAR